MEFLKLEQEVLEIFPKYIKNDIGENIDTIKQDNLDNDNDNEDEEDDIHWVGILKSFLYENLYLLEGDLVYFMDKSNEIKEKYLHEVKSTIIQDFGKEQWEILSEAFDNLELYKISQFLNDNSNISQKNTNKINSLISIYSYTSHIIKSVGNLIDDYNIKICNE